MAGASACRAAWPAHICEILNCGILDMVELENDNTVEKAARRIVDNFVNEASVVKFLWI